MESPQVGLLSVEEARKRLGIPARTVYALAKRGEIEFVRIGRRVLFRKESLDEFVTKNTKGGRRQ